MLSWWWVVPLGVATVAAIVLSLLAARLRRETAALAQTAADLRAVGAGPPGP